MNRQKTVFLASAAHELKTPLAVMKGYYDLLLSGSLGKLNERQRDILQESKESCDRLVRLVSMFLNYSALESGKLVLQLRENDLRDCMNDIDMPLAGCLSAREGAAWISRFIRDLPIFKFDYQKVQQCIANLLDNALKHTPAGGSVTLLRRAALLGAPHAERRRPQDRRRERGAASEQRAGFGVRYGQRDRRRVSSGDFRGVCARGPIVLRNGPGPGDHQAPDSSASRQRSGWTAKSAAAVRSHFCCRCTSNRNSRADEVRTIGNKMAEKERILVVDDEPSIRKYLQTLLEVDGFDVETVSSGKEALERDRQAASGRISSFSTC